MGEKGLAVGRWLLVVDRWLTRISAYCYRFSGLNNQIHLHETIEIGMYLATHRRDLRLYSTRSSIVRTLALLILLACGCGPFGFIKKVSQPVNRSLAQAKVAGAEELAAYEYWSAVAYYEQARELMGYSEYERALDYGTRAKQLADEAKVKADRVRLGQSVESVASSSADAPNSSPSELSTEATQEATKRARESNEEPNVAPSVAPDGSTDLDGNGNPASEGSPEADAGQHQIPMLHDSFAHDEEVLIRGGEWR